MSIPRLLFGVLLVVLAAGFGALGIWNIASNDVQGGRDAVGTAFLAAAALTAIFGGLVLWFGGRRV